ncbi:hypothetical protein L484_027783 [Morus notabilis]|uniref:Uncharacterized protein n=1 Tax=Morus notabilis TaxID=981085 RepID=W9RKX4_9ROSA|nr:hypothetical protein L484_027783 [Morus notabilis]
MKNRCLWVGVWCLTLTVGEDEAVLEVVRNPREESSTVPNEPESIFALLPSTSPSRPPVDLRCCGAPLSPSVLLGFLFRPFGLSSPLFYILFGRINNKLAGHVIVVSQILQKNNNFKIILKC